MIGAGTRIAEYRVESLLGRGGMGNVYLATQDQPRRAVALKVLAPELAADQLFRERFVHESQLAASLEHPNVVPIYGAGERDGVLYIAMRYVAGGDLKKLLKERVRLSGTETISVAMQVAGALDAAHARGLIHRDVKPANILIGEGQHMLLADFGVARGAASTGLTRTGAFLGTVDYAAPEQIEGKRVDGRADIYALGCVVYHCLTGTPPFMRDSDYAVAYAHRHNPVPSIVAVRSDLPLGVDEVVATAMAKDPDDRYQTPTAFAFRAYNCALWGPVDIRGEDKVRPSSPKGSDAWKPAANELNVDSYLSRYRTTAPTASSPPTGDDQRRTWTSRYARTSPRSVCFPPPRSNPDLPDSPTTSTPAPGTASTGICGTLTSSMSATCSSSPTNKAMRRNWLLDEGPLAGREHPDPD